jgi:1-deoxy-D-xylulose-5-phosphate synthase
VKVINLGIPDKFVEQGSVPELQAECGFDFDGILKTIMDVAQGRA